MNKKIITCLLLLLFSIASFAESSKYTHYGFSVKCARCVELHNQGVSLEIQIAWRTFEYKKVENKIYAIYRCQGGHQYWAEIK